jgi:hypothetical protein
MSHANQLEPLPIHNLTPTLDPQQKISKNNDVLMGHREISAELLAKEREGSYFAKYFATHGIVDTLGMLLLVRPAYINVCFPGLMHTMLHVRVCRSG